MTDPKITKIETVIFEYEIQDMGTDYNGFNLVYEKGHRLQRLQPRLREGECPQHAVVDPADSYQYRGNR